MTTQVQQNRSFVKRVAAVEDIEVPAGTFQTFKIETYNLSSGALVVEQWYAPKVGWFTKTRTHSTAGAREETLISYTRND